MTHQISWIVAIWLLSGLPLYENCGIPPTVEFGTVRMKDEDDTQLAIYACNSGYTLQGEIELYCDLGTDKWNTNPPTCVKIQSEDDGDENNEENDINDTNSQATSQERKKKTQDIQEDPYITADYAENLDMTCVSARIKAPDIPDGFVQKYDRGRKGESTFIVAFYSCNDNFELKDTDKHRVYCSKKKWIGDLPKCNAVMSYSEEDYEEYGEGGDGEEGYGDENEEEDEEEAVTKPAAPKTETKPAENETGVEYTLKVSEEVPDEVARKVDAATDVNFIVQPTVDPYTPRVLNQSCGPDKGGCDHNCEMVLYPGENEPRVVCTCYSGFTLDPYNYRLCHDIDECIVNNGDCEQTCKNIPGSFECTCQEGFQIDTARGNTCFDINECESAEIASKCSGGCENTLGSYVCLSKPTEEIHSNEVESVPNSTPPTPSQCEEGFRLSSDGKCVDIDECAEGIAKCENCQNNHGSYDCICPTGYELSDDDEATCVDINECEAYGGDEEEEAPAICSHACENTQGSFICKCRELFHLGDDRRTCIKDSCQDIMANNNTQCSYSCEDSAEGPVCKCPERFKLAADGLTCMPSATDACLELEGNERCLPGSCANLEDGSYKCSCPAGFRNEVYFCKDIDECSEGTHTCSHICFNTKGSFDCQCPIGYQEMEGNSSRCVDIDECSDNDGVCGDMICKNTDGGFRCACPDGSEPDKNNKCVENDLCSASNGGCSHTCSSLDGRVTCMCPAEMKLSEDGFTCVHLDPCANANNGCSQICNKILQGACSCEPGFELQEDGKTCHDFDECIENNGGCEHICVNKPGSFSCACDAGFELKEDFRTCTDVDECAQAIHDCSHYCANTIGSYDCSCPAGFVLGPNKRTCIDVDECLGYSSCSHTCRNTLGSFECECPSGMILDADKKTCVNGDFCSRLRPQCSHFCKNVDNGFECDCPRGLKIGSDSLTCIDVNECLIDNAGCSHTCTNLEGSYSCLCPEGFKLGEDGKVCQDINECLSGNGGCEHYCINANGGHSCECLTEFALQPDGRTCRESDPCRQNNGGCEQLCLADGKCSCRAGFGISPFNSSSCYDLDECKVGNPCPGQSCRNTPGSYECVCSQGYTTDAYGGCKDIDECENKNGGCSGECVNLLGSFMCKCPRGLRLSDDKKSCVKIGDQCQPFRPPKHGASHCTRSRHKTHLYYKTRCSVWCTPGYQLEGPAMRHCSPSGQWDNFENRCVPQMCPRLPQAEHGTILPANCLLGKMYVGERCLLHCHPGYMPAGRKANICNVDQSWSFNSTFDCIPIGTAIFNAPHERVDVPHRRYGVPQQRPFIKCPRNTTVLLPLGHKTAHIILQKPNTNMDFRYVKSTPQWARNLQANLGAGVHSITFRGHDPAIRRGAWCRTVITVRNSEPPKVTFCPPSFEVTLASAQEKRSIVWKEPEFESRNHIKNVQKSNIPGQLFAAGVHRISYEAFDEDGLTARCEFNVVVKAPQLQSLMPYTYGYAQAGERSSKLLANHDSYIICNGQLPVKIYGSQSISLPPGCVIKNIRVNPVRQHQYLRRRLITHRWTPFSSF